jgi:LPS sulfotransferase NodH
LLSRLLDSHPDITCERELLTAHENQYVRWRPVVMLLRWYPMPLIRHRARHAACPVYGFKLFPSHFHRRRSVLRALRRSGFVVVHITREDAFDQALSELVAERTHRWHRTRDVPADAPRLTLPVPEVERQLADVLRGRAVEERALAGLPHLRVVYESDLRDRRSWDATIGRICDALRIRRAPVETTLERIFAEPYSDIVENYAELREALAKLPR